MKKLTVSIIIIWIVTILLNVAAFFVPEFSDWYVANITPIWVNTYSRITGLVSFSVGEIMIITGLVLLALTVIMVLLMIFIQKKSYRHKVRILLKADLFIVTLVCLIMSLNCSILYKAGTLDPNPDAEERQYTVSELYTLRNYIAEKCNTYSTKFNRDENGYIIYKGDLNASAKAALNRISDKYPRLSGFYPDVKPMIFSGLMSQMYMEGYFFPFSLEANVNSYMYIVNAPDCYCHELAHLHGFIYEDEASFLAYLACVNSDDDFFVYSGYMHVLNYVVNACDQYRESISDETRAAIIYTDDIVDRDNIFLTDEMWEKVNKNALLSTETVSSASSTFTDTVLKVNGVEDGIASYSRVVGLLLQYYDGILY